MTTPDRDTTAQHSSAAAIAARIADATFELEVSSTDEALDLGLGGRTAIAGSGGMIFVFPSAEPRAFIMRDCRIAIDLLYLDDSARIVSMHRMKPEPPRTASERRDLPSGSAMYEARLPVYLSGFPCRMAIELSGGSIESLGIGEGDLIGLPDAFLARFAPPANLALDLSEGTPNP